MPEEGAAGPPRTWEILIAHTWAPSSSPSKAQGFSLHEKPYRWRLGGRAGCMGPALFLLPASEPRGTQLEGPRQPALGSLGVLIVCHLSISTESVFYRCIDILNSIPCLQITMSVKMAKGRWLIKKRTRPKEVLCNGLLTDSRRRGFWGGYLEARCHNRQLGTVPLHSCFLTYSSLGDCGELPLPSQCCTGYLVSAKGPMASHAGRECDGISSPSKSGVIVDRRLNV